MTNAVQAGVDDGFSETKIVLPNGKKFKISSRARAGGSGSISIGSESSSSGKCYSTPDGEYFAGVIERADSTAFDDYPISTMNRVVVINALINMGLNHEDMIDICTGLPLKRYYKRGGVNEALVEKKIANLMKNDVVPMGSDTAPKIVSHHVLSEGIAAWIDQIVERKDGELVINEDLASERVGIIDIGGQTTDIAVIKDWDVDISRSSTIKAGALLVEKMAAEYIYEEFSVEATWEQINSVLSTGKIEIFGQEKDVKDIAMQASMDVIRRIESEVRSNINSGADLKKIIFVGGGAIKFKPMLENWFPHAIFADDAAFANARGMQKYAELNY